jgi:hypothetical protein
LLWRVKGKPVSAYLEARVMAELRALALGSGDTEAGGLLLGRIERSDAGLITRIHAFEPFEPDQHYGPAYVLSPKDRDRLKSRIARTRAVGFCRTNLRRDLYLDKRDFDFFQLCFPDPASVFLLVKAAGDGARGAFFIWEDGDIRRHASYAEFPLGEGAAPQPVHSSGRVRSAAIAVLAAALPLSAFYAGRAVALNRQKPAATVAARQPLVSIELIPPSGLPLAAGDLFVPPAATHKTLPRVPSGINLEHHPSVTLAVRVDSQGRTVEVLTRDGDSRLAEASAAALRQWSFAPARLNRVPVACDVLVRLVFRNPQR